MEKAAMALVAFLLAAGVGASEGAVFKVGDSLGWTILGSPNYTAWSLSKVFQVGDTILFEYNKNFHNVLAVSKTDYNSCNSLSSINKYTSGNDSITIKSKGHHYFICGFPGHCAAGQKVDIKISKSSSAAPSESPMASAPASSPTAPSPSSGGASGGGIGGIPAGAPKSNTGTRAAAKALAIVLAVFSFAAMSGGLFRL